MFHWVRLIQKFTISFLILSKLSLEKIRTTVLNNFSLAEINAYFVKAFYLVFCVVKKKQIDGCVSKKF